MKQNDINKSFDLQLPDFIGEIENEIVEVEIAFNELLVEYAIVYSSNLVLNSINLSEDEETRLRELMLPYIQMLVGLRCNKTSRYRAKIPDAYKGFRRYAIPPFINILVQHIGFVHDPSLGLEIYPAEVDIDGLISEEDFMFVENMIKRIPGSHYATEFPNTKYGDPSTMTICVCNSQVRSVNKQIPGVHAVIGAYLGINGLEAILNPRVVYGSLNYFRRFVVDVARIG